MKHLPKHLYYPKLTKAVSFAWRFVYFTLAFQSCSCFVASLASALASHASVPFRYRFFGRSPSSFVSSAALSTSAANFFVVRNGPFGESFTESCAATGTTALFITARKRLPRRVSPLGIPPGSTPRMEIFDETGSLFRRFWSSKLHNRAKCGQQESEGKT